MTALRDGASPDFSNWTWFAQALDRSGSRCGSLVLRCQGVVPIRSLNCDTNSLIWWADLSLRLGAKHKGRTARAEP